MLARILRVPSWLLGATFVSLTFYLFMWNGEVALASVGTLIIPAAVVFALHRDPWIRGGIVAVALVIWVGVAVVSALAEVGIGRMTALTVATDITARTARFRWRRPRPRRTDTGKPKVIWVTPSHGSIRENWAPTSV